MKKMATRNLIRAPERDRGENLKPKNNKMELRR
jgi:hypothetical protein